MHQEDRKVGRLEDGIEQGIGALIEVHRTLGPGLHEPAYEVGVRAELSIRGMRVARKQLLPVEYKGLRLDCGYRLDIIVDDRILVELKIAHQRLTPEHPNSFRSSDLPVPAKSTVAVVDRLFVFNGKRAEEEKSKGLGAGGKKKESAKQTAGAAKGQKKSRGGKKDNGQLELVGNDADEGRTSSYRSTGKRTLGSRSSLDGPCV